MSSFTKALKENFYNVDIIYPHEYDDSEDGKIYHVKKEYHLYDYIVISMFLFIGGLIAYSMVSQMEEKGYMLLVLFIILFCGLLG